MAENLKDFSADTGSDPASEIACQVMLREWAQGIDAEEHCFRYGDIQEIADPIIRAALAEAEARGMRAGPTLPQEIHDLHEARLRARTAFHEAEETWSQLSQEAYRFDVACKEWVEGLLATAAPAETEERA